MVIDTSALVAIILEEPEVRRFDQIIRTAPTRLVSVASVVELTTVLTRRFKMDARPVVDRTRAEYGLAIRDVDVRQMTIACEAMVRFGKGRHPARLNFGDCFSYALARSLDMPLLFKGEDFTHTDLTPAI